MEYTVLPGHEADFEHGLRRSLVGRYGFVWGQIIATIVDSVDSRQQDLIGLASRQPGVWLGGPGAAVPQQPIPFIDSKEIWRAVARDGAEKERARKQMTEPITPPTGPAFTPGEAAFAALLAREAGPEVLYTIAMALNQFAATVEGEMMEPEKFLSAARCLSLANALLSVIPADWQPETVPPEGGPDVL